MPSHRNDDEIFTRLMLKAQVGKAWAQDAIASWCQDGKGVSEDLVEVAAWNKKAAEQGWFKVLMGLALQCDDGEGVKKNLIEARHWCEISAASGDAQAPHTLSIMLNSNSDGDEKSCLLHCVAEQGHPFAKVGWALDLGERNELNDALFWAVTRKSVFQEMLRAEALRNI
jgi:hypothetical protein